jgi:hypothetical protein
MRGVRDDETTHWPASKSLEDHALSSGLPLLWTLVGIGLAAILAIWLLPRWHLRRAKDHLSPAEQLDLEIKSRSVLVQLAGGLVLLVGLYSTWGTLELSRQAQLNERFSRAAAALASDSMPVRVGAITALQQIAKESEAYRWPLSDLLAAYVRERAPRPSDLESAPASMRQLRSRAPSDIQAALDFLKGQDWAQGPHPLDLRNTDLRGADLRRANLCGALLGGAELSGADLADAALTDSDLAETVLRGADLRQVDFKGANLESTQLEAAKLQSTSLTPAQWASALAGHVREEAKVHFAGPLRLGRDGEKLSFFISPAQMVNGGEGVGDKIHLSSVDFRGEIEDAGGGPFDFDIGIRISGAALPPLRAIDQLRQELLQATGAVGEAIHVVTRLDPPTLKLMQWTANAEHVRGNAFPERKFYFDTRAIELDHGHFFVQVIGWTYYGGSHSLQFRDIDLEVAYR